MVYVGRNSESAAYLRKNEVAWKRRTESVQRINSAVLTQVITSQNCCNNLNDCEVSPHVLANRWGKWALGEGIAAGCPRAHRLYVCSNHCEFRGG